MKRKLQHDGKQSFANISAIVYFPLLKQELQCVSAFPRKIHATNKKNNQPRSDRQGNFMNRGRYEKE